MNKLMFITPLVPSPPSGGRALLSALHRACLSALAGGRLLVEELDSATPAGGVSASQRIRGYIDGISSEAVGRILTRIRDEGVSHVYLDGSNLGRLAKAVRLGTPGVEVVSFFHNVEARFFLGALRETRSPRALAVLIANYAAERMAVRHSHKLVTLSRRDSAGLKRIYGRAGTHVLPMAMEDQLRAVPSGDGTGRYALFVGGAFYANEAGARWFARNVAPEAALPTCIVGRGLERLRPEMEGLDMIEVVGGVESLGDWYLDAAVAIAPIFDGSGMKTKVAEALMYGKRIIGTPEAFSGYEDVADQAGWMCRTREDFLAAFAEVRRAPPPRFDPAMRGLYERLYSRAAAQQRLAEILAIPNPGR
jgi:hypothetical protein